jgi:hypothetical protein
MTQIPITNIAQLLMYYSELGRIIS